MSFTQQVKKIVKSFKERLSIYFHFLNEHKHAKECFWISLLIPVLFIFVFVVILPLTIDFPIKNNQLSNQNEFIALDADDGNFEALKNYSAKMYDLKSEELFLQSLLTMAKTDSIGLILNLADSLLSLNIRGVNVRDCQIHHFKMSKGFKHLQADHGLFNWLADPFILKQHWATIPKVPIKIRKAPKDTIEAKKYKIEPVKLEMPDVHFTLKFDRNLAIKVHQVESNSFKGTILKWYYNIRSYLRNIADTFLAFFHLKIPSHRLWIDLKISRKDALAIYRALPHQAALALKF